MATEKNPASLAFAPIGTFGAEAAIAGDYVYLRVPADPKHGRPSQSGKMNLAASTGGFTSIPGSDFRVNLSAGWNSKS